MTSIYFTANSLFFAKFDMKCLLLAMIVLSCDCEMLGKWYYGERE